MNSHPNLKLPSWLRPLTAYCMGMAEQAFTQCLVKNYPNWNKAECQVDAWPNNWTSPYYITNQPELEQALHRAMDNYITEFQTQIQIQKPSFMYNMRPILMGEHPTQPFLQSGRVRLPEGTSGTSNRPTREWVDIAKYMIPTKRTLTNSSSLEIATRYTSAEFAFIDIETSGLSTSTDRILQIAILIWSRLHPDVYSEYSSYISIPSNCAIHPKAQEKHKISREMLKNKPSFAKLADEINSLLSDKIIVGFNNIKFDFKMIESEFDRAGAAKPVTAGHIDLMNIFHKMHAKKNEARDLKKAFSLWTTLPWNTQKEHQATYDAYACMELAGLALMQAKALYNSNPELYHEWSEFGPITLDSDIPPSSSQGHNYKHLNYSNPLASSNQASSSKKGKEKASMVEVSELHEETPLEQAMLYEMEYEDTPLEEEEFDHIPGFRHYD